MSSLRSSRSAFTLIESLIASAIIALTASSVYYAFLRMNDFAIASRCDTAAKVVLERAVNLAQTSDWRYSTPPILALSPGFTPFNADTGLTTDGSISLFSDPSSNTIIAGKLSRQVTSYPAPVDKNLGDLYRVVFKLEYKVRDRSDLPLTTVYAYTLRASDK